jgi:hypothetical protein
MDKRNESINKQIIQQIEKINIYGIQYEKTNIESMIDQQELFKILSEENKIVKNIVNKINKINELTTTFTKLVNELSIQDEIVTNNTKTIDKLDTTIEEISAKIKTYNDMICAKKSQVVETDDKEESFEEPKITIPTIINMEDMKRAFFNNDITNFTELIKASPELSFYKANYKFSSDNDGKPEYIAKNLVGGFVRNMENYAKYFITCFRCYKNENTYTYPSLWIVNVNLPTEDDNHIKSVIGNLYDDFEFTKIDDFELFLTEFNKKKIDDCLLLEKYLH